MDQRVADEIFEERPAPVPSRETELEYLDFLEKDLREDSWVDFHFRKLEAGPLRIPYKRTRQIYGNYQFQFLQHWFFGWALCAPVAIWAAKRGRVTSSGVPKVFGGSTWAHFPMVGPHVYAKRLFNAYFWGISLGGGYVFARLVTPWKLDGGVENHEEMRQFGAMVEGPTKNRFDNFDRVYPDQRKDTYKWKRSTLYRLFFPNSADYTLKDPMLKEKIEEKVSMIEHHWR